MRESVIADDALLMFCQSLANVLPKLWQDFAVALAMCWQSNDYSNRLLTVKITSY